MNSDKSTSIVRKLAKANTYQNLFSLAKETNIDLFENKRDFSAIQLLFLNYLAFYYNLNMDIYLGDVDEKVLENEIFEDAYSFYKRTKNTDIKNMTREKPKNNLIPSTKWVFKTPKEYQKVIK
jgi:hypothetical protein